MVYYRFYWKTSSAHGAEELNATGQLTASLRSYGGWMMEHEKHLYKNIKAVKAGGRGICHAYKVTDKC